MPIRIEHMSHVYQPGSPFEADALEDIDLTINDGDLLALIGHTGSGKSTLAQHLNGLLTPTSGRVLVDGEDINAKGADRRALRQRVGLLFQYAEYQLFEETVYKDIAFGPKNQGLTGDELDARVREAFAKVHLPADTLEKSPFELSGGQMRRVALAGVVAMQPRVLVMDEPIAGLDPKGRDELTDVIRELHDGGVTIVLISHNMDDVARIATRVAV
ncbi:MAG: energy-coupling factor transporter ATPase, partial [Clostridia bacterium]|nr:energy-coupling factor transporter ATPase [Clostridia bacterium]